MRVPTRLPRFAFSLALAAAWTWPGDSHAREPLPTIEVVQPTKRVRLIDVRGPLQVGGGFSTLWRAPVYTVGLEAQVSFVELSKTTWLHLSFGEHVMLSPYPVRRGQRQPGLLGGDIGLGLSRYAPGGPAFFVGVSGGPRWDLGREDWSPRGAGVTGRADVYPFFQTVPEIIRTERRWFRKYIASGLHLWLSARYDHLRTNDGATYTAGAGFDFGRTLLLPVLQAVR